MYFLISDSLPSCGEGQQCLQVSFDHDLDRLEQNIVSAHLWVFRKRANTSRPSSIYIHTAERGKNLIHSSHNHGDNDGWYATQIKVNQILRHPKKDQNTAVKFITTMKCNNCVFLDEKRYTPFISLKIIKRRKEKSRRSIKDNCSSSGCCRKSTKIKFKDIGLDFIFYPLHYDAYSCEGSCSNISNSKTQTKHTQILDALSRINNLKPISKCVPKRYSELSIIYMHRGSFIRRGIPKMVVEECECT